MLETELCNNQTGVGTGIQDPESLHQSTHRHHPFQHSSLGGGQQHGVEVPQQPATPSQAPQGQFDLDFDEDDEGLFLESQEVWTKASAPNSFIHQRDHLLILFKISPKFPNVPQIGLL